jgi:hypothetical protein
VAITLADQECCLAALWDRSIKEDGTAVELRASRSRPTL